MSKPVILITAGKQGQQAARAEIQSFSSNCSMQYVDSVVRAGGAPITLPCVADREAISAILPRVDGVLLTGGGDILSLAYGEEPHPASKYQDPARDEMELVLTHQAMELGLPILGICRGVQLLNVAFGGSLIQDVPSQVPDALQHYAKGLVPLLLHNIEIEPESLLARVMGTTSMAVNSYHHQAVSRVGEGLRVNCRSRDGVIEGVEVTDGRPILGVQFHPEECTALYPRFQSLFDWLVREADRPADAGAARAVVAGSR
jgi:putative glutamine amidotransferase